MCHVAANSMVLNLKNLNILVVMLCLCCCKTKDLVVNTSTDTLNWCPENGTCTFKILTDKRLERHYDEHNALYVNLVDGDQWVIEIEYKKEVPPNAVDAELREQIFLEINPRQLNTRGNLGIKAKLVFARWCYCKGEAGYFIPSQKDIDLIKVNDTVYELRLDFSVLNIPQAMGKIVQRFEIP